MASPSDIAIVRLNINEPDDSNGFTDEVIGDLINAQGVAGASSSVWLQKAAQWSTLTDVTEAGATHKFSDLSKNALLMAKSFGATDADAETALQRTRVRTIERST